MLARWIGEPVTDTARWRHTTSSYETQKASGRVDRTYTWERADRRISGAPIRMDVVIAGNTPSAVRPYVEVPESFQRRYGEMRSTNDLLALIASIGIFALVIAAAIVTRHYARARSVRWRPALVAGGIIGLLLLAAGLNEIPGSWYSYDSAVSPAVFALGIVGAAIAAGVGMALVLALTLVAAEAAARHAFPDHLDWWKLWRYRGTREVAGRVAGGYVVVTISFAYVAVFYVVTRTVFGWWVPTELLDDPNLIASPMPWLSGIAMSLQAGVWEEALFRALPLSLLALWAAGRPHRNWWMAARRGGHRVRIRAGALELLVVAGLFASGGDLPRRVLLGRALPPVRADRLRHRAFPVRRGALRRSSRHREVPSSTGCRRQSSCSHSWHPRSPWRGSGSRSADSPSAPDDAKFGAWTPGAETAVAVPVPAPRTGALSPMARRVAFVTAAVATVAAVTVPAPMVLGPRFTASRATAMATADSALRARGGDPSGYKKLAMTAFDTLPEWRRFLQEQHAEPLAAPMAESIHPPAWWVVRYVHTGGTAAERAEEWRVRIRPDGTLARHAAHHPRFGAARFRRRDGGAAHRGCRTGARRHHSAVKPLRRRCKEAKFDEIKRPARRDVTITYTDTSRALPGGAAVRAWVTLAGNEPLVARRGVELPEAFLRRDRERQTTRYAIVALLGGVLMVTIVGGIVFVTRRRALLVNDGSLGRRATLIALGTLAVLSVATALNNLPETLAGYDTETPWGNFIGTTAVETLLVGLLPLLALALWQVFGALRRRAGIPMLPEQPAGSAPVRHDVLIAGLGLGAAFALPSLLRPFIVDAAIPPAPQTSLASAVPMLGEVLNVPISTVFGVAMVAIPVLLVLGVGRRRSTRIVFAAFLIALVVGVAAAASTPYASGGWLDRATSLALLLVVLAAIRYWGALCAWSWIAAALFHQALSSLKDAVHAATAQEQLGALLAVAVALALTPLIPRARQEGGGTLSSGGTKLERNSLS